MGDEVRNQTRNEFWLVWYQMYQLGIKRINELNANVASLNSDFLGRSRLEALYSTNETNNPD